MGLFSEGTGGWKADIPERVTGLGIPLITVLVGFSPRGIGCPMPKALGGRVPSGLGGSDTGSVSGTFDTLLAMPLRSCFLNKD